MTPIDAAAWMFERFEQNGFLYQEEAASYFLFWQNSDLAYFDDSGHLRLGRNVLALFESMTPTAVYENADKFWRKRLPSDQQGRRQ